MKENYEDLEMEIVAFDVEDVITGSVIEGGDDD